MMKPTPAPRQHRVGLMGATERSDAGSPYRGGSREPLSNGRGFVRQWFLVVTKDAACWRSQLSATNTPARMLGTTPALPTPVRRGRLAAAGADKRAARDAEDRELIRRCQQDPSPQVRAQTVEAVMPLARSLARRYHRGEEPLEDLEQVAALGLLKAIKGFDPDRGSAFASFAVPTI